MCLCPTKFPCPPKMAMHQYLLHNGGNKETMAKHCTFFEATHFGHSNHYYIYYTFMIYDTSVTTNQVMRHAADSCRLQRSAVDTAEDQSLCPPTSLGTLKNTEMEFDLSEFITNTTIRTTSTYGYYSRTSRNQNFFHKFLSFKIHQF